MAVRLHAGSENLNKLQAPAGPSAPYGVAYCHLKVTHQTENHFVHTLLIFLPKIFVDYTRN